MFTIARITFVTAALALLCTANAYSQSWEVRDRKLANVLSMTKNEPDPKLKIEPTSGLERSTLVSNKAKTRSAYVLCVPVKKTPEQCDALVFVKDLVTKTIYVITGEPGGFERYRPVDDLKWVTDDVLSFERWTGPHFGHRFVFNVKLKKQTAAFYLTG